MENIPYGATVIRVEDNFYRNFVDSHDARKHLYIELYDGTVYTVEIMDNLDLGSGVQQLSLSAAFDKEINISDMKLISYLLYARLTTDTINFKYLTNRIVTVDLTFTSLKEW